jgi:hypothetical protein
MALKEQEWLKRTHLHRSSDGKIERTQTIKTVFAGDVTMKMIFDSQQNCLP